MIQKLQSVQQVGQGLRVAIMSSQEIKNDFLRMARLGDEETECVLPCSKLLLVFCFGRSTIPTLHKRDGVIKNSRHTWCDCLWGTFRYLLRHSGSLAARVNRRAPGAHGATGNSSHITLYSHGMNGMLTDKTAPVDCAFHKEETHRRW